MRKIFTLIAALFIGSAAFAQVDNTLQFTDKDGNVVEDGSTWHAYEKTEDMIFGTQIHSGLSVKNTTNEDVYVSIDYQFTQTSGGIFQICYPVSCKSTTFNGTEVTNSVYNTGTDIHLANETEDILIEWIVKQSTFDPNATLLEEIKGTCTLTLQLKRMNHELVSGGDTPDDPADDEYKDTEAAKGPKITLVLHNDGTTAGVSGVADTEQSKPVAYYSIDGRRLPVAQKGLNIVKFADGTTRKVVKK